MRNQGGRPVKINPVDEVRDHPERGRVEALFDQNLFRMQIQRERSASFWFAASLFGVTGLVIGACLGAYMMYVAYTGLSGPVRDNITAGMAIKGAREDAQRDPLTLNDSANPSP